MVYYTFIWAQHPNSPHHSTLIHPSLAQFQAPRLSCPRNWEMYISYILTTVSQPSFTKSLLTNSNLSQLECLDPTSNPTSLSFWSTKAVLLRSSTGMIILIRPADSCLDSVSYCLLPDTYNQDLLHTDPLHGLSTQDIFLLPKIHKPNNPGCPIVFPTTLLLSGSLYLLILSSNPMSNPYLVTSEKPTISS